MKTYRLAACLCLLGLNVQALETLNYEGSSTVGKFINDAAKVYDKTEFKLNMVPESAGGEQCALRKRCDLGGVARDINPRFIKQGVVKTLIGKDAIAVLVHPDNPVQALSRAQLKDIFTGKINNWQQVGGTDASIRPLIVKASSATRKVFAKAVLDGEKYQGASVMTPDAKIANEVARDLNAIGQLSFAFIQDRDDIRALNIDNQEASVNNTQYPITRPLHIATYGEPDNAVKAFIDWTLSTDGQAVLKQRFVGIK